MIGSLFDRDVTTWFRIGLILLCSITMGWAIWVLEVARRFRTPSRYVYAISISYILALLYIILATYDKIHHHQSADYALPEGFAVVGIGLIAMYSMRRYYRYRSNMREFDKK